MEFILFYESMERELQNAYLLRAELNKRGHDLYIFDLFKLLNEDKQGFNFIPDAILVPYLYEKRHLESIIKPLFKGRIKRIVNIQYEQIISCNKKQLETQLPKGLNKNALHLCWGQNWQRKLIEMGIKKENAPVVGSINIDMDRERFSSLYKTKKEMANEYNLNNDKKWIIFISSFGMVNLTEFRKKYYIKRHGDIAINNRIETENYTKKILLEWIMTYINENDCEFIYRPHPSEIVDDYVINIENNYNNFHIIKQDSVRSWIKVCDKIHTWYSTCIVDIYFMKKTCSIIRPIDLPEIMHNDILNTGNFTRDYESFCRFNNEDITEFPMDEQIILDYFDVDEEKYAYEKICDLLEDIVKRDVHMEFYKE